MVDRSRDARRRAHSTTTRSSPCCSRCNRCAQTVDLGYATEEAVDAVHFALQELGVQYDVDPGNTGRREAGTVRPCRCPRPAAERVDGARRIRRAARPHRCRMPGSRLRHVPADRRRAREPAAPQRDGLVWRVRPRPHSAGGHEPSGCQPTTLSGNSDFALQLAEFTERTGITVEFMPDEAQAPLNRQFAEPNRRPDVLLHGGAIPRMGRGPRTGHRPVHRIPTRCDRTSARTLHSVETTVGVGGGLLAGGPDLFDSARHRPEGSRVLPGGGISQGRVRGSEHVGRTRRARLIRSRPTVAHRGASASSRATRAAGPVPTSSRVWCSGPVASTPTTPGPPARSDSRARM